MEALRIRKRLDSDTLHLSGLKNMVNKDVEIIILVEDNHEQAPAEPRPPGSAKGLITVAEDFHKPLDEDAAAEFYR